MGLAVIFFSQKVTYQLHFEVDGLRTALTNNLLKFLPIAPPIAAGSLQASLEGKGFTTKDPDVRAVMEDEFRRANRNKALRCALFTVFVLQVPLGLAVWNHPTHVALYFKVVDAQLTFEVDLTGKAGVLVLHQGGRSTPAKRVE